MATHLNGFSPALVRECKPKMAWLVSAMSSQKHLECGSTFKKRNMQHRALKKEMDKDVSEMTKAGIIESSFSEYVHQL